ncbi:biotin transporter BioY [Eubacterium sp.]|uniref:biotin transporter BioY n=1 Tax=Eubacterium sp. TaxID=142586 RepID=UPI002FC745E4
MEKIQTKTLTHIALVTALLCIIGPLSLPIPISPVPISLTQLGVYAGVYTLGKKKGTLSFGLYLLIGAMGVPVFSGFAGGLGKIVGPTGGYLLGFVVLAWVVGCFVEKWPESRAYQALGMVIGNVLVYILGTAWLMVQAHLALWPALMAGVIPYVVFDVVKAVIALLVGPKLMERVG